MPLEAITLEDFYAYVNVHLPSDISKDIFSYLYEKVHGESRLIQYAAYKLYTQQEASISQETIEKTLNTIINENDALLRFTFGTFASSQVIALKLIIESGGKNLYQTSLLGKYNITQSSIQRALKTLITNEFLDKEDNCYTFTSALFELWCQEKLHIY